jgi:hypothetical protein
MKQYLSERRTVMEQQKKRDTSSNHEVDPFSAFMFGKPRIKDEKINEDKEPKSFSTDDWILGSNHRGHAKTEAEEEHQINQLLNNVLSQMNTEEVMKNIDLFIETAQEFKPLWKKFYPHIQKWMK